MNFLVKLRILLEKIYKDGWSQQSARQASNQQNLYTILLAWLWKVQKSLFNFFSLLVTVSRAFVYNVIDVNKITTAFLAIPPP